jgi:hypothetical protein
MLCCSVYETQWPLIISNVTMSTSLFIEIYCFYSNLYPHVILVLVWGPFSQVVYRVCSHHGLDQAGSLQVIKLLIWLEFVV